ncbi:DNA primase small subunit domain-containing protein [Caldivirga maquilingensis]|uniref:DNA primase small subunit PriS n=1 Tax=Caldivirga maquilingensis (strain ATCC 700844 / DSM 13496 / JCM 10307 / IC-167) TaxID=397948 RepID=A8M8Y5_CALMQ|nr:DNA primase small subunit [Caldivirga maquilingensis]ABW02204.1 putative DNA primase, small subunit [Caldivirga maquilingensis IC-167]
MDESLRYIEVLFKNYYRNYFKPPGVPRIENREVAYQPFTGQSMIRHLGFRNWNDLRSFITERIPRNLYLSSAYFNNPSAGEMDAKGWLGADLVFDIDGDHLPTDNCRGVELVTIECLNDALSEVVKLIDVLRYEFGIEEKHLRVTFSGHRGFHVHVEGPEDVINLTQDERRMIVDYLTGKVDLTRQILVNREGRATVVELGPFNANLLGKVYGSVGRVFTEASKLGKVTAGLVRDRSEDIKSGLTVHIDEVVTIDTNRLMRMPNSLHGKTGLIAVELSLSDLDKGIEAIVDKAVAFRKGNPRIRLTQRLQVSRVLGEVIRVKEQGEEASEPAYVAVYLILMGLAQLAE